jgi:hypothetical protein
MEIEIEIVIGIDDSAPTCSSLDHYHSVGMVGGTSYEYCPTLRFLQQHRISHLFTLQVHNCRPPRDSR